MILFAIGVIVVEILAGLKASLSMHFISLLVRHELKERSKFIVEHSPKI